MYDADHIDGYAVCQSAKLHRIDSFDRPRCAQVRKLTPAPFLFRGGAAVDVQLLREVAAGHPPETVTALEHLLRKAGPGK
jgi:hypothetical protein